MATLLLDRDPFVKWQFKCKNEAEKKRVEARANETLKYYLDGVVNGYQLSNPLNALKFAVSKKKLKPVDGKKNVYAFEPSVKRVVGSATLGGAPGSVKTPKEPKRPPISS